MQLKAKVDDLHVEVEGIGRVPLPVPAKRVRQLREFGQPARYGRGEETLTDSNVRDTWEIPANLVQIERTPAFGCVLDRRPALDAGRRAGPVLVLTKSQALFEHERQARSQDEADLQWLTTEWNQWCVSQRR